MSAEDKAAGAWSWPSPSNTEVKNVWSYTSTPPHIFMAVSMLGNRAVHHAVTANGHGGK